MKEKKFLQVAEKHLDCDVQNAHICLCIHPSLTLGLLFFFLQAYACDEYNWRSYKSRVSAYIREIPGRITMFLFYSEVQFNDFVSKYTIQEDKIHGLWTQIQNEQAKLAVRLEQ